MGGSAFVQQFGIESKRIPDEQYLVLTDGLQKIFAEKFNKTHLVQSYRQKQDHGDADFLIWPNENPVDLDLLGEEISATHRVKNSNITSYLIGGFQVDLIFCQQKWFETSCFYYDFDPSGNLSGKLAHKFGLKLGHDGLSYILRDCKNTYKLGQIDISNDPEQICKFLDLNWGLRKNGFDTQKEIFEYVVSSKYFNHKMFSYEAMNHIARTRDRKRESYRQFMQHIEGCEAKDFEFEQDKEQYLGYINDFFPKAKLTETIEQLFAKRAKITELSQKFNGEIAMKISGLVGRDFGTIFGSYKAGKGEWLEFLDDNSSENIQDDFKKYLCQQSCKE